MVFTRRNYHILLALWGLCALASCIFALNTLAPVTGYTIADALSYSYSLTLASILLIVALMGTVITRANAPSRLEEQVRVPEHIQITSSVKQDTRLYHLAQELTGKERTQKEINHLLGELAKGNTNPGLGSEHLADAGPIMYARGRNGARIFYIPHGAKHYEIVGYSDKNNQERVIRYLREKYAR